MPRYGYRCQICGSEEERIVSIDDRNSQICKTKDCKEKLRKLPSSPALFGMDKLGRSGHR